MMVTRSAQSRRYALRLIALICTTVVFLQILAGCGSPPPNTSASQNTPSASPTGQSYGPVLSPVATPGTPSVLHGPSNFVLHTPFKFSQANGQTTPDSGTPTPIDPNTLESQMTQQFQHVLFVVDSSNQVSVYIQGSSAPIKATVTQRTDGSVDIDYSKDDNASTGSTNLGFQATLFDNQIYVQYQQSYSPTITSSGIASSVTIAFSTAVQWVQASEIPTPPLNARFQFASNQTIILAWDAGQHAVAYDVYRMIPSESSEFEFLATVKDTTYTDTSADSWQNAHTSSGVTYGIFAVGPTGVENPNGLAFPIQTGS
jgi:hypothetical protein